MKIKKRHILLVILALLFDAIQILIWPVVLFEAALCTIPSMTGIGVILTAICELFTVAQIPFFAFLMVLPAVIWSGVTFFITKKKVSIAAGAVEAIPVLNMLPAYTATTIYLIWKRRI